MPKYHYPYSIDPNTLAKITGYRANDWEKILNTILNNKSVELNIDFTNSEKLTKLFELYNIIITYKLNDDPYKKAVVNLLIEHYDKESHADRTLLLIQTVDYIQPSAYYPELELLLTSPAYEHMSAVHLPGDFSISFYLLNALMMFDTEGNLFELLKTKQYDNPPPEYYQLMIRYLYTHRKDEAFSEFMNAVFPRISDEEIKRYILMAIKEFGHERRTLVMLFNWIFPARKSLGGEYSGLYHSFCSDLLDWLVEEEETLHGHSAYYPLFSFLSSGIKDQLTKEVFDKLLKETSIAGKFALLYYIGSKNGGVKMIDEGDEIFVVFPNESTYLVTTAYKEEVDWFQKGSREGIVEETIKRNEKFELSPEIISKSIDGDNALDKDNKSSNS